jgi:UDP-N-acetylglucosamine--N-acetylmuramyl-(pentapeptide) pyrophosphoryl-undecaprenol N-acetylglucosamine transferase
MVLSNIFDGFKLIIGVLQSFFRLLFSRPNVIFLKGGYVCLPVGIAAKWLKIPYVIHDSDAAPGLTNRILAGHAVKIATGMPLDFYKYPEGRAVWTGIPISSDFVPVSKTEQKKLKEELGFDSSKKLVVVTGGSLGARHINEAVVKILPELLKESCVALISGQTDYEALKKENSEFLENKNFQLLSFTNEIVKFFGAADVVVSRAGASTLSELASMEKAVVLVPNHKLPGFHQVKNAENYEKSRAAMLVSDAEEGVDEKKLLAAINSLLGDEKKRAEYSKNLGKFAKNDAAKQLAEIVLAEAK